VPDHQPDETTKRDDRPKSPDVLLTTAEVAMMFRVDPNTVSRWASQGKLSAIRTPGGHRRFRKTDVDRVLDGEHPQAE
jgi:excisionase family DNA binding protein